MKANWRALDEIVARQRAADSKAREEAERLPLFPSSAYSDQSRFNEFIAVCSCEGIYQQDRDSVQRMLTLQPYRVFPRTV